LISLIFSTFNGEGTLPAMLAALRDTRPPASGWEIVAVDNGSTDRSAQILQAATAHLPLRYLSHPARGKNRALNAAVGVATGELLVFTDDDVLPDPRWLQQLEQAAAGMPEYDILGGSIRPHWPKPPDAWILEEVPLGMTYALTDPELPRGDIYPGLVWGPNMLVRSLVFDTGLRFNETVGPAAGQYIMGSETEFNLRASAAGHRCGFEPCAIVSHIIRETQMERRWVLARAYRYGRNVWNEERSSALSPAAPKLLGMPRWRIRKYLDHRCSSLIHHLRGQPEKAFRDDWELSFLRGYFAQWWAARRATGATP
jgi:glycosyltransferase involved in cell wall biosynthesis